MTLPPEPYSDMSSPVTAPGIAPGAGMATPARHITEPYRQLGVWALLAANGVLLFLGVSRLLFVIDGWAADFGARSAAGFGDFVGPLALGLPLAAVLVATHVPPMVARSRAVLITALAQLGTSALFGAITFLGAFAYGLPSVRATLEGLLERTTWLALLVFVGIVVFRVLTGLFPAPPKRYAVYTAPVYGRPYPGQPMFPHQPLPSAGPDRPAGLDLPGMGPAPYPEPDYDDELFDQPTSQTGWPVVPPPPTPTLAEFEPTMRVTPVTAPLNGEATRRLRPPEPPAPPPTDGGPPATGESPDGAGQPGQPSNPA